MSVLSGNLELQQTPAQNLVDWPVEKQLSSRVKCNNTSKHCLIDSNFKKHTSIYTHFWYFRFWKQNMTVRATTIELLFEDIQLMQNSIL